MAILLFPDLNRLPGPEPAPRPIAKPRRPRFLTDEPRHDARQISQGTDGGAFSRRHVLDHAAPLGSGALDLSRLAPQPDDEHVRVLYGDATHLSGLARSKRPSRRAHGGLTGPSRRSGQAVTPN